MGVIVRQEYVCDYCKKPISAGPLVGRLTLRKEGARGAGRGFEIAFHATCSEKLTSNAESVTRARKRPARRAK